MYFGRYDYAQNISEEREKTFGVNIKYDFRLTNNISGNIKFGNKFRTKKRSYDRHHEFGISSFKLVLVSKRSLIDNF